MDYQLHFHIRIWIEEAAEKLRQSLSRDLAIDTKTGPSDLVTEMDVATEQFFRQKVAEYYPDHRILGEESTSKGATIQDTKGILWIIDPIDGTMNFVKAKNYFAIQIGIYEDGQPLAGYIYPVMTGDLYYGIVGQGVYKNDLPLERIAAEPLEQSVLLTNTANAIANRHQVQALVHEFLSVRCLGAASLEILEVILGHAGAYASCKLCPWDFAAGLAICQELPITVTRLDGSPLNLLEESTVLFAQDTIHAQAIQLMQDSQD